MDAHTALTFVKQLAAYPGVVPSMLLLGGWIAAIRLCRNSFWMLSIISLPGTIAHEGSHLVVAILVLARPTSFSVWPRRKGNAWEFGAVEMTNAHVFNAAFVALAPLLLLPIAGVFIYLAAGQWAQAEYLGWVALGYLGATSLYAATPSAQDFSMGGASLVFYTILVSGAVYLVHRW